TFALAGTTAANATGFSDTTVAAGTSYFYRACAMGSAGNSAFSSNDSALVIPAAPANLFASAVSTTRIDLTWDASIGAASFVVDRSSDGGSTYVQLATPASNSYSDTTATEGTVY